MLDCDGDGLLDLLVGECYFQGGMSRSRLFRNLGNYKFENVTAKVGLPEHVTGFGVAACDVNGDGWPDVFLAGRNGGNRLLHQRRQGQVQGGAEVARRFHLEVHRHGRRHGLRLAVRRRQPRWPDGPGDRLPLSDRPWYTGGVRVRLYLNRGVQGGWPRSRR